MRASVALALAACHAAPGATTEPALPPPGPAPSGLHVAGNQIVDGQGRPVQLVGVNRSGTEYACVQGWGIFDGPSDDASVAAIASWGANAVRVPLNEDCWLAINGVAPAYSGEPYQHAIRAYIDRINAHGMAAIVDLHWNAPGAAKATDQQWMADRDHAPAFWRSVAAAFAGNSSVVFDLYNEPHDLSWACWRDGGRCGGVPFEVAGMQELVAAVRESGAKNLVLAGGLGWANDLSGWLAHAPDDPAGNLAASLHAYGGNACETAACLDATVGPVLARVPVVAGEIGESFDASRCSTKRLAVFVDWLEAHHASYLVWVWDTWAKSCKNLSLITSYDGTPKPPNGTFVKRHLARRRQHSPDNRP